MLTQFRIRYPKGSLISELVEIVHGKYVVRALIRVEGVTLATGLAAAETVEQAEDSARNRALALVDLEPPAIHVETTPTQQSISPTLAAIDSQIAPAEEVISQNPPFVDVDRPQQKSPISSFNFESDRSLEPSSLEKKEIDRPSRKKNSHSKIDSSPTPSVETPAFSLPTEANEQPDFIPSEEVENAVLEEPSFFDRQETVRLEETFLSQPNPSLETTPTIEGTEEIDFSIILQQSNHEMIRLGWTQEQGREYLLETYGKRSRQLLSDEELLEFLQYLKSQPTPVKKS